MHVCGKGMVCSRTCETAEHQLRCIPAFNTVPSSFMHERSQNGRTVGVKPFSLQFEQRYRTLGQGEVVTPPLSDISTSRGNKEVPPGTSSVSGSAQ